MKKERTYSYQEPLKENLQYATESKEEAIRERTVDFFSNGIVKDVSLGTEFSFMVEEEAGTGYLKVTVGPGIAYQNGERIEISTTDPLTDYITYDNLPKVNVYELNLNPPNNTTDVPLRSTGYKNIYLKDFASQAVNNKYYFWIRYRITTTDDIVNNPGAWSINPETGDKEYTKFFDGYEILVGEGDSYGPSSSYKNDYLYLGSIELTGDNGLGFNWEYVISYSGRQYTKLTQSIGGTETLSTHTQELHNGTGLVNGVDTTNNVDLLATDSNIATDPNNRVTFDENNLSGTTQPIPISTTAGEYQYVAQKLTDTNLDSFVDIAIEILVKKDSGTDTDLRVGIVPDDGTGKPDISTFDDTNSKVIQPLDDDYRWYYISGLKFDRTGLVWLVVGVDSVSNARFLISAENSSSFYYKYKIYDNDSDTWIDNIPPITDLGTICFSLYKTIKYKTKDILFPIITKDRQVLINSEDAKHKISFTQFSDNPQQALYLNGERIVSLQEPTEVTFDDLIGSISYSSDIEERPYIIYVDSFGSLNKIEEFNFNDSLGYKICKVIVRIWKEGTSSPWTIRGGIITDFIDYRNFNVLDANQISELTEDITFKADKGIELLTEDHNFISEYNREKFKISATTATDSKLTISYIETDESATETVDDVLQIERDSGATDGYKVNIKGDLHITGTEYVVQTETVTGDFIAGDSDADTVTFYADELFVPNGLDIIPSSDIVQVKDDSGNSDFRVVHNGGGYEAKLFIGQDNLANGLEINADGTNGYVKLESKHSGGDIYFYNKPNDIEIMRLKGSGSVGIGTDNPGTYKLAVNGGVHVVGNLDNDGKLFISHETEAHINLTDEGANNPEWGIKWDGAFVKQAIIRHTDYDANGSTLILETFDFSPDLPGGPILLKPYTTVGINASSIPTNPTGLPSNNKFYVNGLTRLDGSAIIYGSGEGFYFFDDINTNLAKIENEEGDLKFFAGDGTLSFRICADAVEYSTGLRPTNSTVQIGSSWHPWNKIYGVNGYFDAVGIGTTSPSNAVLDIAGGVNDYGAVIEQRLSVRHIDGKSWDTNSVADGDLYLQHGVNYNTILNYNSSGNVGIGTIDFHTIHSDALLFGSSTPKLEILTGTGSTDYQELVVLRHSACNDVASIRRIGLLLKLSSEGSVTESNKMGGIILDSELPYANSPTLHLVTGNAKRLTITADGHIGIGTTSPSSFKLEVAGSIGPSSGYDYDLGSYSRPWAMGCFQNLNVEEHAEIGDIYCVGFAAEEIYSPLVPDADNAYDLGSSSKRWGTVYANKFQGDFIKFITPVSLTLTNNTWNTVDLSSYVPVGTTVVLFQVDLNSESYVYLRKNSSSSEYYVSYNLTLGGTVYYEGTDTGGDDFTVETDVDFSESGATVVMQAWAPINSDRTIQIYPEHAEVKLIAYV